MEVFILSTALYISAFGFLEILSFLGISHPAVPLREASQAAPLCACAHASKRYKQVPYLPRLGYKIISQKSAL
jgi:hypothetical protein